MIIKCRIWPEDDIWNAEAINMPVVAFGDTRLKAMDHIQEAVISHLEALVTSGKIENIIVWETVFEAKTK